MKNSNLFLLLVAFISGMSIMAMEISASRLLAPYFGTSLFVWTNIIGIVMASLAVGYYIGGKWADRKPDLRILLKLILVSGLIFLIIPWVVKPLASIIISNAASSASASVVVFGGSLIIILVLFAFPLILLGMVSPFIIKLYSLNRKEDIGKTAGNVFALSTVGSILGTFLPTLLLIPFVGTRITVTIFAVILVVMSATGLFTKKYYWLSLFLLILPLVTAGQSTIKFDPNLIAEDESVFQYIQVVGDDQQNKHLVYNEGGGTQSVYQAQGMLTDSYYDYFSILPYFTSVNEKNNVLILGLAGGTISRQLNYYFDDQVRIDGVEIDKKVIELAEDHFDLNNPSLTVHNQDGRVFLQNSSSIYDIVIVDAYQQQMYIPWTLTTQEFWQEVKGKLSNTGICAININATSTDSELLKVITNTMASVFNNVYLTKISGETSWNYMVSAGQSEINFKLLSELVDNNELTVLAGQIVDNTVPVEHDGREQVLTDDRAPIEFMTDKMIVEYVMQGEGAY